MSGTSARPSGCGRRATGELRLDVAHRVVAEGAGEPAAESRQPRTRRHAVAAQERADEVERVAVVPLDDGAAVVDLDRRAARADAHPRRQADERVAAEALAAHDGLEQERVLLVRELDVERQRRVEIGERLEHERNAVVTLGGKRAEFGFGHDASELSSGRTTGQSGDCAGHRSGATPVRRVVSASGGGRRAPPAGDDRHVRPAGSGRSGLAREEVEAHRRAEAT